MCSINPTRIVLLKEKSEVVLKPSTFTPHVLSCKRANDCEVVLKHHKDVVYTYNPPVEAVGALAVSVVSAVAAGNHRQRRDDGGGRISLAVRVCHVILDCSCTCERTVRVAAIRVRAVMLLHDKRC